MSYKEDFEHWRSAQGNSADSEAAWFAAMRKYGPPICYKRYGYRFSLGISGAWYGFRALFNGLYAYPYMNQWIDPYTKPRVLSWLGCLHGLLVNLVHAFIPFVDIPEAARFRFQNLKFRHGWLRETFWFV